jgi:diaminopimelate decarboxylase
MHQLELAAAAAPDGQAIGLRVNPGIGSGHNNRLTTGGPAASFGLWHEYLPRALAFAHDNNVKLNRLHVHVGTGGDPAAWGGIMDAALAIAEQMPQVTSLDIGGGYKIAYGAEEKAVDMLALAAVFGQKLTAFAARTGRRLKLEIEPGRWLVAHAGCLITEIVDIVDTGKGGFTFLRTNTGMNDFLRATMYGAQHHMAVLNDSGQSADYVVVGHNCETGDILTPAPHDPEGLAPRTLSRAQIGDLLLVFDAGAYCASMRARGYNAFPDAAEVLI